MKESVPDAQQIADRFGIGNPTSELVRVPGGNTNRLYRLTTDKGSWAVKALNRSFEGWWMQAFQNSVLLEFAAISAGVRAPQYVLPTEPTANVIAEFVDDDTTHSIRVYEWVNGTKPSTFPDPTLVRWVASTMAQLSQLQLPCDADLDDTYRQFPLEEWRTWSEDANTKELRLAPMFQSSLNLIIDAQEIAAAGLRSSGTAQLLHRDFTPDNVLNATDGPVLLDWDSAGPDIAYLDFIRSLWRFAGFPNHTVDRQQIHEAIVTYVNSGGEVIDDNDIVFAGLFNNLVTSLSYFTWRALGHRGLTPDEQAASDTVACNLLDHLHLAMQSLDEWKAIISL